MERVTTNFLFDSNLFNIFKNNLEVFKAQEKIGSGKRLNRPSDDPVAQSQSLRFNTAISINKQYLSNTEQGISTLNVADAALNGIGGLLARAKELALSQASAPASADSRKIVAEEVENIINQVVQLGNTSENGNFVFSGIDRTTRPFTSGAVYFGSHQEATVESFDDSLIGVGLDGSDILVNDINPALTISTPLSSLLGGAGVTPGSISITDRAGNATTVDLSSASTMGDVINSISNSAGINVTASINGSGNGLTITDNNTTPVSNLVISEAGGGTTASSLGILVNRPSTTVTGLDLNPALTTSTSISQLNGGKGLSLSSIQVVNGAASGTVTLQSASTVGDVLNAINNLAGINATASINSSGTSIEINSNSSTTFAHVLEVGTGTTASDLGLGGGVNVIKSLSLLRDALNNNDVVAIRNSAELLDSGIDQVLSVRGIVGARTNRLEVSMEMVEIFNTNTLAVKSSVEDADMVKAISDLAKFQAAYEATLQATAGILQVSLMDFIR
ncbi:MAG: flagellar hook-associated protein FlgL [Nitrospinota bacterium]